MLFAEVLTAGTNQHVFKLGGKAMLLNALPAVEPIPLPAPVWLFKVLHALTVSAHFYAVHLMVGGLVLAVVLAFAGRAKRQRDAGDQLGGSMLEVSGTLSYRLPVVMALLINLGIPPLLFTQVLYGRPLYTATILMGAFWISVVFLLCFGYYMLYRASYRALAAVENKEHGSWRITSLIGLICVLLVGFLYTNAFTFMLRPEAFAEAYAKSPGGVQLNTADPSVWPRWLIFMFGGLATSGLALPVIALKKSFTDGARALMRKVGPRLAIAAGVAQVLCVFWYLSAASGEAMDATLANLYGMIGGYGWLALWLVTTGGAIALITKPKFLENRLILWLLALLPFVKVALLGIFRDVLRDQTLLVQGFDVWDRTIVTNWSVVGVFGVLLVAALAVLTWLVLVSSKASHMEERYAL